MYDERQMPARHGKAGRVLLCRAAEACWRRPLSATTAIGSRRSLIGSAIAAFQARAQRRTGRPSRVVAAVQANVMTFAGLASVDFAFFHLGHFAGFLATGVSILLADFKLQG